MIIKAVIFDLDGTLLDSLGGIAQAMNTMLQEFGYPPHTVDHYKYLVGSGIHQTILNALPHTAAGSTTVNNADNPVIDQMVNRFRSIYDTLWPDHSPPYEGIPELLQNLQQKKIQTAVLSNKSDDFTRRISARVLGDFNFAVVRGSRPGVPIKPDPTAALEIAQQMDVQAKEIIFLGDSGIDMETAVRAAMIPIGALWGFREVGELLQYGAQKVIRHPLELLAWLG